MKKKYAHQTLIKNMTLFIKNYKMLIQNGKLSKKKDERTDELLSQNQEVMSHIKDIKMEVYELNRKIDTQQKIKIGKFLLMFLKNFFMINLKNQKISLKNIKIIQKI